jgi:CheY-like chemotaxis protein
MSRILVAEDSSTQGAFIAMLLENEGHTVTIARDGALALAQVEREIPDLLLTDLIMPSMTGLQLIEALARSHPLLPIILMTDFGSEDVAAEALQKGAMSYIPKRRLEQDVFPTINNILGLTRADRRNQALLASCEELTCRFELENDPNLVPNLVAYLRDLLSTMKLAEEKVLTRIAIALTEAIDNALHHGNLELSSKLRDGDGSAWRQTGELRRKSAPYKDRRVHVRAQVSRSEATIVIRDEGPGFDVSQLPDPTDPAHLESNSGRGVFLMRAFMDVVEYSPRGNELTLVKRKAAT